MSTLLEPPAEQNAARVGAEETRRHPQPNTDPAISPPPDSAPEQIGESRRIQPTADKSPWLLVIAIAVGAHLALLGLGLYSSKDTLLEMIAQGEQIAIDQPEPPPQEIELAEYVPPPEPPPPPEPAPEFVKPEETPAPLPKPPEPIVKKEEPPPPPPPPVVPRPVVKPKPTPTVQRAPVPPPAPTAAPRETKFAASAVVIGNKNFPKPPYPYEAKAKRFQGTVTVSINIVSGRITSVQVVGSSGYGILDSSAASWIRERWTFPENTTRSLTQPVRYQLGT